MRKILIFSIIFLLFIPFFGAQAEDNTGYRTDESEWFSIENIELSVPDGIPEDNFTIRVSTSSRNIKFRHSGAKPVYLPIVNGSEYFEGRWFGGGLQREEHLNNDDIPEKLQYPRAPHTRVVNDQIYFLGRGSEKVGFFPGDIKWAKIDLFDFFSGELRQVLKYGDNRPGSVTVPDTRTFDSKRILYDGQFYRISADIDFDLNENYDPTAQEDFQNNLSAGEMPVYNTKPWWIKYLAIIGGALENMWERLF